MSPVSVIRRWLSVRSGRRTLFLVAVWTFACYGVFHYAARDQVVQYGSRSLNTRLLLEKVIDFRTPRPTDAPPNVTKDELLVDRAPIPSDEMIVEEVQNRIPSLPITYWHKTKNKPMYFRNSSCAKFPSMYDLEFDNIYWQTLRSSNGTFHFFGAYYDVRKLNALGPSLRILGMINRIEPTIKTFCQLWFENEKEPVFTKVFEYKYIWYKKWGNYKQNIFQPYLLACQIPSSHKQKVPASVSVVEKPCNHATNNLRVIYNKPEKKASFAVCVKGLDFMHEDISVRLVEWLELLNVLGAHKVFLYELEVHPNISKVLRYYEKLGMVDVRPMTLPGGQPNLPGLQHLYLKNKINNKRQNELIPYNDCLYRNLYSYEFIALLDTDEVIVPVKTHSWKLLMETVLKKALAIKADTRASYNVRNVYFLDDLLHDHGWFKDVPRYMHMLQHVYRSRNFTKPGQYVKCFHNPERVLTLHNHFPLACLSGPCTSYPIEVEDAQLQHYRADCVKTLKNSCKTEYRKHSIMDTTIWRYKEELTARVTKTLVALGFLQTSTGTIPPVSGVGQR